MKAKERFSNEEWAKRHNEAVDLYTSYPPASHQHAYLSMLSGWASYAEVHKKEFDSSIGDDSFLGPEWEQIGRSLRALLNGEIGPRLDAGTLDGFILDTAAEHGVDLDG